MHEFRSGYLKRSYLSSVLQQKLEHASKQVVNPKSDNQGYEIGKNLGYTDALKEFIQIVEQLPDDPKPTGHRKILGKMSMFD